ncbi:MAG: hypothetical protein HY513_04040 [Candidatus Aenigmarchaeota archaeon]|nr:hypothetical protein [Candidatus Aenigmarchaeota archaeon]
MQDDFDRLQKELIASVQNTEPTAWEYTNGMLKHETPYGTVTLVNGDERDPAARICVYNNHGSYVSGARVSRQFYSGIFARRENVLRSADLQSALNIVAGLSQNDIGPDCNSYL